MSLTCEIILTDDNKKYVPVLSIGDVTYPHEHWVQITVTNETLIYPSAEVKRIRIFERKENDLL